MKLIVLHYEIIISNKLLMILLTKLLLVTLMLLYFSNYYLPYNELITNKDMYYVDYLFESVSFIKIMIVVSIIFIILSTKSIQNMDPLLLNISSKKRLIISRLSSLILLSSLLTLLMLLIFVIIGVFLTPYDMVFVNIMSLVASLLLFTAIYSMLTYIVYFTTNHVYSLGGVLVLYLIGTSMNGSLVVIEEVSWLYMVINLIHNDVILFDTYQYGFMFGYWYVLAVVIGLFIACVKIYITSDIIN